MVVPPHRHFNYSNNQLTKHREARYLGSPGVQDVWKAEQMWKRRKGCVMESHRTVVVAMKKTPYPHTLPPKTRQTLNRRLVLIMVLNFRD